jgi:hypothetical protein
MNSDSELLAAVKESFASVRLNAPLDATVQRGRKLRARRRTAWLASAAVIAGGAALTAALLVPGGGAARPTGPSPAPSGPVRYQTAAWTVARGPGRTVTVLIRQLSDPAGLQRALRAAGVPAAVAFEGGVMPDTPPLPRSCSNLPLSSQANAHLQARIVSWPAAANAYTNVAFVVHTAEIPQGIGLNLTVQTTGTGPDAGWGWSLGLVQASPACTGS